MGKKQKAKRTHFSGEKKPKATYARLSMGKKRKPAAVALLDLSRCRRTVNYKSLRAQLRRTNAWLGTVFPPVPTITVQSPTLK